MERHEVLSVPCRAGLACRPRHGTNPSLPCRATVPGPGTKTSTGLKQLNSKHVFTIIQKKCIIQQNLIRSHFQDIQIPIIYPSSMHTTIYKSSIQNSCIKIQVIYPLSMHTSHPIQDSISHR